MCASSGGGGGDGYDQLVAQQQQEVAQQQASDAQLVEQQREFNVQQVESQQTLANTQALQVANQASVDNQAALTEQYQTGQSAELAAGTKSVNDAFAQFTPDYYDQYIKDYANHYAPQVYQQYGTATNDATFGLARTGNLQSQTAADQYGDLARQKGNALDDINNAAIGATTTLQNNVESARQNLLGQVTSAATLGSPVTPGSADAVTAQFNNTTNALSNIRSSAGDTINTLTATPTYSSLGSLFSSAAGSASAAVSGNNAYGLNQAFGSGLTGAANPNTASSGRVT